MALLFFKTQLFIPKQCVKTVYEIDFQALYKTGKRFVICDIDNTLVTYEQSLPAQEQLDWLKSIQDLGFEIVLVSNNRKLRVSIFAEACQLPYVASAKKPLKSGFKKAISFFSEFDRTKIIVIGDQLVTDIFGGNRMGLETILVKAIHRKSERWFTKMNRAFERKAIKAIRKKDFAAFEKISELGGVYEI